MASGTRVDFYVLQATGVASRLNFACRLTEKAYALEHRVYAHMASPDEARQLNELLWTFKPGSFIPHSQLGTGVAEQSPVTIGMPEEWQNEGDLLINLSAAAPAFATNFARVAEIVDGSEESRAAGRIRFRQYREMGLEPETHVIEH